MSDTQEAVTSKHVYVMSRADGAYKIGYSSDPVKRCNSVKNEVKQYVSLIYAVERRDALRVEEIAHSLLEEFRLEGEWFRINESVAIKAVHDACVESDRRIARYATTAPRPFGRGYEDFQRAMLANPYPVGSDESALWLEGWNVGFMRNKRETSANV